MVLWCTVVKGSSVHGIMNMDATTLILPEVQAESNSFTSSILFPEMELHGEQLIVEPETIRGSVLRRSHLSPTGDVSAIHLTNGCSHRAPWCPCRGSAIHGVSSIRLLRGAARALELELLQREKVPRAVQISPLSDPFLPAEEIQEASKQVVAVLASHNIEAWIMTRGEIIPEILDALVPHREWIKLRMPLTTLDEATAELFEPLATSPATRIRQIQELRSLDFSVQVSLEPLLPGLTDNKQNVTGLLHRLADIGVSSVAVGYLPLTSGMTEVFAEVLGPHGWDAVALNPYHQGLIRRETGIGPVRYLAKSQRQRSYGSMMAWGAEAGVRITVSAASNPDFTREVHAAPKGEPPRLLCGG